MYAIEEDEVELVVRGGGNIRQMEAQSRCIENDGDLKHQLSAKRQT